MEVTVDAFPGEVFTGEIESLDARVAQDTRTLLVRGSCPTGRANCCPACSPTSSCSPARRRDVVTVPRTAVTYSLYGDSVYVGETEGVRGRRRQHDKPEAPAEPKLDRRSPLREDAARRAKIAS